ncbi:MAG TPA: ABC transporter ATP-binding protein, partial [Acidimicrobiales bacterium]|nr:ABC transporter ATP-binding protein [Acidimicrobiales bacterium]
MTTSMAPADAAGRHDEAPSSRLLEVTDLTTTFRTPRGPLVAVDGVSLSLDRGETLGVVGESGSGKTVLSRSIMGLVPGRTTTLAGSVCFDGHELVGAPDRLLRERWGAHIAMVFQDPMASLNPTKRIGTQIAESLRLHLKLSRHDAKTSAVTLLTQVGIPSPELRARQYPVQLSGGMRQRVMIAIAISCGPKLLLADEPTTGLDVTIQAQILDLLGELQRIRQMAMILVTHDLGVVATRTDRIMVMYAGRVVELAPTRRLFANVRMPYTEALLRSTPRLADKSHTRLNAIDGRPPDLVDPPVGCAFAARCAYAKDKCRAEAPPLTTDPGDPDHAY